jgi:hypothetical protein
MKIFDMKTCILDFILEKRDIKINDIAEVINESDWTRLFETFGKKHVNRIPELIAIYRKQSLESFTDKILYLLERNDAVVFDKIFRCLEEIERDAIKQNLEKRIVTLENEIEKFKKAEDESNRPKIKMSEISLYRSSELLKLMKEPPLTVPSLFDIITQNLFDNIAQTDLITDEKLDQCPNEIKEKVNDIKESIFYSLERFKFMDS